MALSATSIVQVSLVAAIFLFTLYNILPISKLETDKLIDQPHHEKYPMTFIPAFGLGTWLSDNSKVADAVATALDSNYRHIDAAAIYRNEKEVGDGLAKSPIPRSQIWITSKLWNDAHAPKKVRPALEKTLRDLGVEYLDLYLMHWPVAQHPVAPGGKPKLDKSVDILDTWHAMEELVDAGLVKDIGISNFAKWQVEQILDDCRIRPTAHEFETHPYLQQQNFVDWNRKQGIQVIGYSPFGNINPIYEGKYPNLPPTLEHPVFVDLAKSYNATPAQIILSWGMQRGVIVIPKSIHEDRIVENLGALDIRLSADDLESITEVDKKARFNNPSKGWGVHLFSDLDDGELIVEVEDM